MRFILYALIGLTLSAPAFSYVKPNKNMDLCKGATHAAEQQFNIPQNLLRAISLTESGRWVESEKANIAWPWTVASGRAGEFFPTKEQAIRHVRALQAKGIKNIDVGCMQINLRYHPDAFENLNEAFDPRSNARYSAKFLSKLFKNTKSWTKAAGHYHSTEPTKNMYYREKVLSYWNYANKEAHESQQVALQTRKPKRHVEKYDRNRMAMLNNNFQSRLSNQRKAMTRAEEMSNKISQYRNSRRLSNFGKVNVARQQALLRQKQKKSLTLPPVQRRGLKKYDFSQRRSAQMEKWRKTIAKPDLLSAQKSGMTTPNSLLSQ
ncbi:exported hypothetical protein [Candidatus Terasakiella magnetica]|uniref:Transglycosylase SLT domain-containing protein n=1 Tax=Candidatus Terasakiella magnetica TaxID=1867952 RepID=A0A1C3RJS5_9PROT|nr:transglycosylase SLT domain-containing protein [Candidatus Terasakiella magnetica]SCA57525.1 exported hypothetical protein [Candidatus Terasakiella magnetica]